MAITLNLWNFGMAMNERDERAIKEAIKEMDSRVIRDVVKDAVKELVGEQVRLFGWWSLRTLGYAAVGAAIIAALWLAGFQKVGG